MNLEDKKKKVKKLVKPVYDLIDPSGYNWEKFEAFLDKLSGKQLADIIAKRKDGVPFLTVEMPNMITNIDIPRLFEAADKIGAVIFSRLIMYDQETGEKYLTTAEFPILNIPVRRTQQFVAHKMSTPDGDEKIDHITGQVTGDAQASSIGKEEIQILYNRGLTDTLREYVQIRGGSPEMYAEMKRQIEETGTATIDPMTLDDPTRVSQMTEVLMLGAHLDLNLTRPANG